MAFTLRVSFGGLCLFVQEQKAGAAGLYVLLPSHGNHKAELVYDGKDEIGGTPGQQQRLALKGDIPLTGLLANGTAQPQSGLFAPVSRILGRVVPSKALTDPNPPGLSARLRLDLGYRLRPTGKIADMEAVDTAKGITTTHCVVGTACLSCAVTDTIHILGHDFWAAPNETVDLWIVNVDLTTPACEEHHKHEPMDHFKGYYGVHGVDPKGGPTWQTRHATKCPFDGYSLGYDGCAQWPWGDQRPTERTSKEERPRRVENDRFIDPHQCTLGIGCPETDPDCDQP